MKKLSKPKRAGVREKMRADYDFSGGVRGKYVARFEEGTSRVVLAPDVAAKFPAAAAVNRARRAAMKNPSKGRTV